MRRDSLRLRGKNGERAASSPYLAMGLPEALAPCNAHMASR
jgi:hypothetical protein